MPYRGRYAPSPTGPLHFGSLVAALGGWLDARAAGGQWLVRIEDLDAPRCVPGAADSILRTLDALGLAWDGEVVRQSRRIDRYRAALAGLAARGATYPCACSRREIADSSVRGIEGPVYPGTCRSGLPAGRGARAVRVRVDDDPIMFEDRVQGRIGQRLAREVGDFVVDRADGCVAYQLAVVVDDAEQGVTDVVRGADLLSSTPRQIHLQRLLGLPEPRYAHLPVAVDSGGEKLSKQTRAPPVDATMPGAALTAALAFLGHAPPRALAAARPVVPPAELLAWATGAWSIARVPAQRTIAV